VIAIHATAGSVGGIFSRPLFAVMSVTEILVKPVADLKILLAGNRRIYREFLNKK